MEKILFFGVCFMWENQLRNQTQIHTHRKRELNKHSESKTVLGQPLTIIKNLSFGCHCGRTSPRGKFHYFFLSLLPHFS